MLSQREVGQTHEVAVAVHVVDPSDGGPELVALHPRGREGGGGARVRLLPLILEAHLPRVRGGRERAVATRRQNISKKIETKTWA